MSDIEKLIEKYWRERLERTTDWLEKEKFISRHVLDRFKIGSGKSGAIAIPIRTVDGGWFFKFRADPYNPKQNMRYWCSQGAHHDLYPREILESNSDILYIVEGELKALTLISSGYPAITGTGGAGTFKDEWVEEIKSKTKKVVILFDEDATGKEGAKQCALKFQQ